MSEASGGAPGQGGRSEVHIGLPLATIYDLSMARHHLKDILTTQAGQALFLTGDGIIALEFVLSVMDSLNSTVQLVLSTQRRRHAPKHRRKTADEPGT